MSILSRFVLTWDLFPAVHMVASIYSRFVLTWDLLPAVQVVAPISLQLYPACFRIETCRKCSDVIRVNSVNEDVWVR